MSGYVAIANLQSCMRIGDIIYTDMGSKETTITQVSVWRSDILPTISLAFGLLSGLIGAEMIHIVCDVLAANHPALRELSNHISDTQVGLLLALTPLLAAMLYIWVISDCLRKRTPAISGMLGAVSLLGSLLWLTLLIVLSCSKPVGWNMG